MRTSLFRLISRITNLNCRCHTLSTGTYLPSFVWIAGVIFGALPTCGQVITIPVGNSPIDLALGEERVFVSNQDDASITIIDRDALTVLATVRIPSAGVTRGIGFNDAANLLYVGIWESATAVDKLIELDGESYQVLRTMTTGGTISDVDVNPRNGKIYVCNDELNQAHIIDPLTWEMKSISLYGQVTSVAISGWDDAFFSTHSGFVYQIDAESDSIETSTSVGWPLYDVTLDEPRHMLYAVGYEHLHFIEVSESLPLRNHLTMWGFYDPRSVAISGISALIAVVEHCGIDLVKLVDSDIYQVVGEVPVGACPLRSATCSESGDVFVVNTGDASVSVVQGQPAGVSGESENPSAFTLFQNYPNPFNPITTISYQLPENSHITLTVSDVLGKVVATLVNGHEEAGFRSVTFDGSNLASGLYFYHLQAGGLTETRKLVLMK